LSSRKNNEILTSNLCLAENNNPQKGCEFKRVATIAVKSLFTYSSSLV